jgi:hypothetical protein
MSSTTPSGSRARGMLLPLLLTSWLSACSQASLSDSCRLLPLVEYPQDRALVIARQIQAAPAELQRFALDAVELRDSVRACRR